MTRTALRAAELTETGFQTETLPRKEGSMSESDSTEVFRKAHELEHAHGLNAFSYAARQAERALVAGETDEHAFWQRVAAALRPR
jgi:hypothetical protein